MLSFLVYLSIMTGIYAILSLSLNFQYGFTGLANFGHVAFFMIGAYTSTILVMLADVPFLGGLLGAMVTAGLFGLLISLPTMNLKEDYWAIVTLASAEIVRLIFLNQPLKGPYHGASFGIGDIPRPLSSLFSPDTYPYFYLGIVLTCLGLTYLVLTRLERSPFGRTLKAIREGDELPQAFGKDVGKFKMRAMAIGGAFGGVAGSLFAHYTTFIDPFYFMPIETFIVWAMVIVGGKGNNLGAIVGAAVVQAFYSSTRFLKDYIPIDPQTLSSLRMVIIGALIILVMLFMKEGLIRERRRIYELPGSGKGTDRDADR